MKNRFIINILLIAALGCGISAQSQEQKKPSERSFARELSRIKQIQKERTKLIDQTKTQTPENSTSPGTAYVPVKTGSQNSRTIESSPAIKPSSGEMRKTKKPVASKG
ncbi:MAG TPA: hypothetical protein VFP97_03675 [Chitinophagaceae bacterium]|nr:hypothetical protein [Chitinophagaceae bacterium]